MKKTRRKLTVAVILAIVLSLGCITVSCGGESTPQEEEKGIGVLIPRITNCARLYIVQYNVRKILTYESLNAIEGSIFSEKISIPIFGDRKILIPIDATVKGYIDFSEFTEENVKVEGDKIEVTLPMPKIEMTSSKLDYENEKKYVSWNRSDFTEEEKEALIKQGRASILSSLAESDIIEKSKTCAFNALLPIFQSAGYDVTNITLNFPDEIEKNPKTEQTIQKLMDVRD